jgi:hypothetical protein
MPSAQEEPTRVHSLATYLKQQLDEVGEESVVLKLSPEDFRFINFFMAEGIGGRQIVDSRSVALVSMLSEIDDELLQRGIGCPNDLYSTRRG